MSDARRYDPGLPALVMVARVVRSMTTRPVALQWMQGSTSSADGSTNDGLTIDETYRLCPHCRGCGRVVPDGMTAIPPRCGASPFVEVGGTCVMHRDHDGDHFNGTITWPPFVPLCGDRVTATDNPCTLRRGHGGPHNHHPTPVIPHALTEDEVRGLYDLDSRRDEPSITDDPFTLVFCGAESRYDGAICTRPRDHDGHHSDATSAWSSHPDDADEPRPGQCPSTYVISSVGTTIRCALSTGHLGRHSDVEGLHAWDDSPFCVHVLPKTERRCIRIPHHIGLHSDGDLAWDDDGTVKGLDPVEVLTSIGDALDPDHCPSTSPEPDAPYCLPDGTTISGGLPCTLGRDHDGYHGNGDIVWSDHGVTFSDPAPVPIGTITIDSHRHLDDLPEVAPWDPDDPRTYRPLGEDKTDV